MDFLFYLNSVLFGVGLAMDAFSVSVANGLNEPDMKTKKTFGIAGVFAFFQALMPMTGWICVHTIVRIFGAVEKFVPWIALALLCFIGGKMIVDGIKGGEDEKPTVGFWSLIVQGIATSIDALSVGFTIADYDWVMALVSSLIIAFVTLGICFLGVYIGKKVGNKFSGKATVVGGIILVAIGIEIFVTGII